MPMHIFFGLVGYVLAIAAALLGLGEKAIFKLWVLTNAKITFNSNSLLGVYFILFCFSLFSDKENIPNYQMKRLSWIRWAYWLLSLRRLWFSWLRTGNLDVFLCQKMQFYWPVTMSKGDAINDLSDLISKLYHRISTVGRYFSYRTL